MLILKILQLILLLVDVLKTIGRIAITNIYWHDLKGLSLKGRKQKGLFVAVLWP